MQDHTNSTRGRVRKTQFPLGRMLWGIIGVSLLIHAVALILGQTLFAQWRWEHAPVHSAVEMSGAVVALFVAYLLISLERRGEGTTYNVYIAAGLMGMGALDAQHALVQVGNTFVWLHSTATFVGGALFVLVWLPPRWQSRTGQYLPWGVLAASVSFGVVSIVWPAWVPNMVQDGQFTLTAMALNLCGGVLLFGAAVRLVTKYWRSHNSDDLLFCLHCSLFGAAAIMFEQSALWDLPWWGWHLLRLLAYGVALWFVLRTDQRAHQRLEVATRQLRDFNTTLEQRIAERTRRLNEHDRLFDLSLDMMCVAGFDGYFKRVNPAFERILGYSADELLSQPFLEFVHPDDREPTERVVKQLAEGGDVIHFDNRYRCKDGTYKWLSWSTPAPRTGEDLLYAVARDITEKRRVEEDLRRAMKAAEAADRAKSAFLANMSHEIRTPMNGVIGMADLMAHTTLTEEQQEYLQVIQQSADSLLSLLNDILDLSKIESGKLELEQIDFSLRDTIGYAGQMFSVRAAEKGLEVACRVAPDVPDVLLGDPGRLRQIVVNLVGNAIKFTEQGEIVINVVTEDRTDGRVRLRLSVKDTGIGIPPEKQSQIFNAFAQADTSTTRRFGGTGLGLTISSQLVEIMGGSIWVKSTPGEGSTFHFTAVFEVAVDAPSMSPVDPTLLAGKRVLVIDDNATNRRIFHEMFKSWAMPCRTAAGGSAGLAALREAAEEKQPFDLVVLDCTMPEMDGFTVAASIRNDVALRETRIIMVSSAAVTGDAGRARRLGIIRFMTKPVVQSDLLRAIDQAFSSPLAKEEEQHAGAEPDMTAVAGPPLKILLAEDSLVNQRVAMRMLQKCGHSVTVAADGGEAVRAWGADHYDLVLMDVQMPNMDGYEATAVIRQREKTQDRHTPVIAMTANAMKGDRERCLAAGMDGYIAKPIDRDRLHRVINEFVPAGPATKTTEEPSPPDATQETVNIEHAMSRAGGDMQLVAELADGLRQESSQMMEEIHAGLERRDNRQIQRAAHTLKGTADLFAARRVVELALAVETRAREGRLDGIEEDVGPLADEVTRMNEALADVASETRPRR